MASNLAPRTTERKGSDGLRSQTLQKVTRPALRIPNTPGQKPQRRNKDGVRTTRLARAPWTLHCGSPGEAASHWSTGMKSSWGRDSAAAWGRSLACVRSSELALPESGSLLRRLRSRRRCGPEVSEACGKSASRSGLPGDTGAHCDTSGRLSEEFAGVLGLWEKKGGAQPPAQTPFLWAEELEGHCPGRTREGRRQGRGDRIGRGIAGDFLKDLKIGGFLPYPGDRLYPVQRISAFSLCSPEMKQMNDNCSLLGRGDWKTGAR